MEAQRAEFGRLGVISRDTIPEQNMAVPAKGAGAGAGRGAGLGALTTVAGGAEGGPFMLLLGIVLMPVGAVVGAGAGASLAVPSEQVEQAEIILTETFLAADVQSRLRVAIIRRLEGEMIAITDSDFGPKTPKNNKEKGYQKTHEQGVQTILEVTVESLGLAGPWTINPPLLFVMNVRSRLIWTTDDAELHALQLTFHGSSRHFTKWADNQAAFLKQQLESAVEELAEKIVTEHFLLFMPDLTNQKQTAGQT